ncbi:MAG TPA: hypothetical protein VEY08_06535, partial [Chloroflexia bacterium]|nr:hypothetical protein [Chloroflexia bacterium]
MKSPNKSYVGDQLAVQPQITVPLGDTAGIAMRPGELHQGQDPGPAASLAEGSEPSESDLAEKKNTQDWLRAAYAEAWKQVTHEDTLSMQRNGIFIVIQTALLATLASLSVALVRAEAVTVNMYSVPVAYFAMGSIFLLFSYFAVKLLNAW